MTLIADFVTGKTVTFQRMRALLAALEGIQEGVVGGGDLKVAQRAAGGANMSVDIAAGDAYVQVDSGVRNGLAHAYSDALENRLVAASHATLPRIDYVILRYNDSSIPAGAGGDVPTLEVLAGTPTASVTLDAPGVSPPALPNDALLLAAILVPAASTSVVAGNIRDRRKWARGFNGRYLRKSATDYATTSTSWVGVDDANMSLRCELGSGDIEIALRGFTDNPTGQLVFGLFGAAGGATPFLEQYVGTVGAPAEGSGEFFSWRGSLADLGLTPGSQVFRPGWRVNTGTAKIYSADNTTPASQRHVAWSVTEHVRQNATN